jgi:hypothetical protein
VLLLGATRISMVQPFTWGGRSLGTPLSAANSVSRSRTCRAQVATGRNALAAARVTAARSGGCSLTWRMYGGGVAPRTGRPSAGWSCSGVATGGAVCFCAARVPRFLLVTIRRLYEGSGTWSTSAGSGT